MHPLGEGTARHRLCATRALDKAGALQRDVAAANHVHTSSGLRELGREGVSGEGVRERERGGIHSIPMWRGLAGPSGAWERGAAHPAGLAAREGHVLHRNVASAISAHRTAIIITTPVHKVQRLQVEAAAARDGEHAGALLAVERRALPAAPDREEHVAAARDVAAKGKAGARRDVDARVAVLGRGLVDLVPDVLRRAGEGLAGDERGQRRWRQLRRRRRRRRRQWRRGGRRKRHNKRLLLLGPRGNGEALLPEARPASAVPAVVVRVLHDELALDAGREGDAVLGLERLSARVGRRREDDRTAAPEVPAHLARVRSRRRGDGVVCERVRGRRRRRQRRRHPPKSGALLTKASLARASLARASLARASPSHGEGGEQQQEGHRAATLAQPGTDRLAGSLPRGCTGARRPLPQQQPAGAARLEKQHRRRGAAPPPLAEGGRARSGGGVDDGAHEVARAGPERLLALRDLGGRP